jgi:hypothetical protein
MLETLLNLGHLERFSWDGGSILGRIALTTLTILR